MALKPLVPFTGKFGRVGYKLTSDLSVLSSHLDKCSHSFRSPRGLTLACRGIIYTVVATLSLLLRPQVSRRPIKVNRRDAIYRTLDPTEQALVYLLSSLF